jgi:hypothetical protein
MYLIGNRLFDTKWWNQEKEKWAGPDEATRFTTEDVKKIRLPPEGYWCPLWSVDFVQFSRLISEASEAGAFAAPIMSRMAESMDLTGRQVCSLIDRAINRWDEAKMKLKRNKT